MVAEPDTPDPVLKALKDSWPPAAWEKRLAEARSRLATLEAVSAAIAGGMSESAALATAGGGLNRSTYRGRWRRFRNGDGLAGLFNKRRPPPPERLKATPPVRGVICAMRLADPNVSVERIAEVLADRFATRLSTTVIKRVLREEGLNQPRGGKEPRRREAKPTHEGQPLVMAGAVLLSAMDEEIGLTRQMAEGIHAAAAEAVAQAPAITPAPEPEGARSERGHFTAIYNQANTKGDAALGPVFRSVEEKRREVALGARKVASEGVETIRRKCQAMVMLPLLADDGKACQTDDYRAHHGLTELCGRGYAGDTLERFLRDLKYLALSDAMLEQHMMTWLEHEPRAEGEEKPAAFILYIDGSPKGLWTDKFTKAGKVTSNGRVMPCLDQMLVHTGTGTPIFWKTFSGHASLATQALPIIEEVEAKVGPGWQANRIVVMDSEGSAVGLLAALKEKGNRDFITILKPSRVPELSAVRELSAFEPYRKGDEVAEGRYTLKGKGKQTLDVRVVLVRRVRAGQTRCLVTSVAPEVLTAAEVADSYFKRWPAQELRFKTFSEVHFKGVSGYGKQLVTNVTVVNDLDKLKARKARLLASIATQTEAVKAAKRALVKKKLALNAAKARRDKHDARVANELAEARPDLNEVWDGVEVVKTERERYVAATTALAEAEATHEAAEKVLAETSAKLPAMEKLEAELESRRTIYRADVEQDQIATTFKLSFALLCELVAREYFDSIRMSLAMFIRQFLLLPGTRKVEGYTEHIKLACPPNPVMRARLEAACRRVNERKIRRNGLVLRLTVDTGPPVPSQRSSRGP